MEIPENWQEELMLHDWKMMKIERCKNQYDNWYSFPNGIDYRYATFRVHVEKANALVNKLSKWNPKKKVKGDVATIKTEWKKIYKLSTGEFEDFLWEIYSFDI